MALQIAICWSDECEKELIAKGFVKETYYVKDAPHAKNSKEECELGDSDFFRMAHSPYQFVTTSFWGAGVD